jgi:hypothetical protein
MLIELATSPHPLAAPYGGWCERCSLCAGPTAEASRYDATTRARFARVAPDLPKSGIGARAFRTTRVECWKESQRSRNRTGSRGTPCLAPRVGLEPTTLRLTAGCSTIELPRNVTNNCRKGPASCQVGRASSAGPPDPPPALQRFAATDACRICGSSASGAFERRALTRLTVRADNESVSPGRGTWRA